MRKHLVLLFTLTLSLIPLSSPAEPLELVTQTQGSFANSQKFESLGRTFVTTAEAELQNWGGYQQLHDEFQSAPLLDETGSQVWQNAISFHYFLLQNYGVYVDIEVLAAKMGLDRILNSTSDAQFSGLLSDLQSRFSFEQKMAFAAQLGGALLKGYDNVRADAGSKSEGIVTLRQMLDARQQGKPAGVCRDISVGVAQVIQGMGAKAYVTAYRTTNGFHATVIALDPSNPQKTYNINYDYVTSEKSSIALNHLAEDSTNPMTGISTQIYSADGKPLTELPSHLGTALVELSGGQVSDLDPMLRSENDVINAFVTKGQGFEFGSGVVHTPDGTTVAGFTAAYSNNSERAPGRVAIALYKADQKTSLYGPMDQVGGFLSAKQRIYSKPLIIEKGSGKLQMRILAEAHFNMQLSQVNILENKNTGYQYNTSFGAGGEISYKNKGTQVDASVIATGSINNTDIRNERSFSPYFRDITAILQISQQINKSIEAFMKTQVTVRNSELGAQARQEIGARLNLSAQTDISIQGGYEGQIAGQQIPFIPGSQKIVFLESAARWKKKLGVSGGIRCLAEDLKSCSYYAGGRLSLKLKPGELEKFLGL